MRKTVHGAVTVPIAAALLIAAAGCSGGTTTAAAGPTHSTASSAAAPTTATATPSGGTTATAGTSSQPRSSSPAASATASSGDTSEPFPGIWDITSWEQYRKVQAAVEQGHQPWRLDPVSVVDAWAAQWGPVNLPVRQVGPDTYQVVKPGTHVTYTVRGTRPDPSGPAPIWVITSITHD
ncbi:MAG TPA: hypothetical protein VFN97_03855 [Actinospica sp.]|nr:hypothetical protein [Actinospica sp.]